MRTIFLSTRLTVVKLNIAIDARRIRWFASTPSVKESRHGWWREMRVGEKPKAEPARARRFR
jgi:hypothetical protein